MDPLSVTASVIAVLQLAQSLVQGIQSIKDSSRERQSIRDEVIYLSGLLFNLQSGLKREELSPDVVSSLNTPSGPLAQLKDALESLAKLLLPVDGLKKVSQSINWAFQKDNVASLLSKIERQKTFILFALENNQLEVSRNIRQEVESLQEGVNSVQKAISQLDIKQQEALEGARLKLSNEALAWLSPLNFLATQNEIQSRTQKDSCQWLLTSSDYQRWRTCEKQLLWCWGPPGYGKTFLASQVVSDLRTNLLVDEAVACIFFDHRTTTSKADILASVLQQLSQRHTFVRDAVSTMYTFHLRQHTRPDVTILSALLSQELQLWSKVYVVIDALDEYADVDFERLELVEVLMALDPSVQLLFTSRIEAPLEVKNESLLTIAVADRNGDDLKAYIQSQTRKTSRLSRLLGSDDSLRDLVLDRVLEMAQGMFLLVKLQMDLLSRSHNKQSLLKMLEALPVGLDQFYEQTLTRVAEQDDIDSTLARQILIVLSGVYRPLHVTELQHALMLLSITSADPMNIQPFDKEDMISEDTLTSVCLGLVMVKRQVDEVQLVHSTLHHYLEKTRLQRWPDASEDMSRACLNGISSKILSAGPCQNDEEMMARLAQYPFLRYAGRYWGRHLQQSGQATQPDIILDVIRPEEVRQSIVQLMHLPNYKTKWFPHSYKYGWLENSQREPRMRRRRHGNAKDLDDAKSIEQSQLFPKNVSTLQIASHFGFVHVVRILLSEGSSVYAEDSYGWTALHRASENGYTEVVKLLLDNTADPKPVAAEGGTALHRAAKKGHQDIVELLAGLTPVDIPDQLGCTPLHRAARHGHSSVASTLIALTADVNACSKQFDRVQSIIQKGLSEQYSHSFDQDDLTALKKVSGGTPMHEAAINGHVNIVDILIKAGASVNIMDTYGGYPLHRAAAEGHLSIVEMLVRNGSVSENNRNATSHLETDYGRETVNGHVYFIMSEFWGTPLHLSSRRGHVKVVEFLISHNADVESKDFQGQTPLTAAAVAGSTEVMRVLLEHGARIDGSTAARKDDGAKIARNDWYRGWRHEDHKFDGYSASSKQEVLRTITWGAPDGLLTAPASIGLTPLHDAAWYGQLEAVRLLIQHGASIDRQDDLGRTPLMLATENGQHSIVMTLMQYRADITLQDNERRSPLKAACELGDTVLVELFLDSGLTASVEDESSNLLLAAAGHRHFTTMQMLLDRGVDPDLGRRYSDEDRTKARIHEYQPPTAQNHPLLWLTTNPGGEKLFENFFEKMIPGILTVSDLNALAHEAQEAHCRSTFEFLLDRGAEINSTTDDGKSFLITAVGSPSDEQIEVCTMLINRGIDINIRDSRDRSALILACQVYWGEPLIRFLIKAGARVDQGQPLTHLFYWKNEARGKVVALLESGCDPNAANVDGDTGLMLIMKCGDPEGIEMMLKHGGNPEIANKQGETALSRALGAYGKIYDVGDVNHELWDKMVSRLLTHCSSAKSFEDRHRLLVEARKITFEHAERFHRSSMEPRLTPQKLTFWASLGKEPVPKAEGVSTSD